MDQLLHTLQGFLNSVPSITGEASQALNLFVFFVQWAATILSALAGFFAARKHGMDVYGSLVIGFVVSLGGGTLRDVLLGRYPIFWVAAPVYAVTVVVVALSMLFIKQQAADRKTIVAKVAQPVVQLGHEESKWFMIIDSLALGLWAYLGTTYALQLGTSPVVAPIMGVVTASFGGVLRDLFFARVPQEFMPGQLYSTAAATGAVAYVLLWQLGFGGTIGFLACFALTFLIRVASVRLNIQTH
jgi:uncharacterized membrane protein YeiH